MTSNYIKHFETRIKRKGTNQLTRENYCVPTDEVCYKTRQTIAQAQAFHDANGYYPGLVPPVYYNIPNEIFKDAEHYTEQHVAELYRKNMENFDLNMRYFASLNEKLFQKAVASFTKKYRMKEITDLGEVSKVAGIYLLILDNYKQAYIGKAETDIKKRILQHWSKTKEFDLLVHGDVNKSIISIDSFEALDTTRIFYREFPVWQINQMEKRMTHTFPDKYSTNRVSGGLNAEMDSGERNAALAASRRRRVF